MNFCDLHHSLILQSPFGSKWRCFLYPDPHPLQALTLINFIPPNLLGWVTFLVLERTELVFPYGSLIHQFYCHILFSVYTFLYPSQSPSYQVVRQYFPFLSFSSAEIAGQLPLHNCYFSSPPVTWPWNINDSFRVQAALCILCFLRLNSVILHMHL